jgi:predicted nucleic acid-binding protein
MASKLFLDANLLLDFTLQRKGYSDAREIISLAIAGDFLLCTTPAVLHITAYWLAKSYQTKKPKQLL